MVSLCRRYTERVVRKASVVIEKDEYGFYAWCPELKDCQSQGNALEEAIANIKAAIEIYLETLPAETVISFSAVRSSEPPLR